MAITAGRVLLVDDEKDALAVTRLMLELHGAEVITAPAAAEGLKKVQTHTPDVIVSDIGMPQMDGYQFIRTKFACAWRQKYSCSSAKRTQLFQGRCSRHGLSGVPLQTCFATGIDYRSYKRRRLGNSLGKQANDSHDSRSCTP